VVARQDALRTGPGRQGIEEAVARFSAGSTGTTGYPAPAVSVLRLFGDRVTATSDSNTRIEWAYPGSAITGAAGATTAVYRTMSRSTR
jgi:hypothetical protein